VTGLGPSGFGPSRKIFSDSLLLTLAFEGRGCDPLAVKAKASDGGAYPRSSLTPLGADPLVPRGPRTKPGAGDPPHPAVGL
jgi:hypothetical protein